MKVSKIVLTGGPGAGKTTVLRRLQQNLEEKGYKVIIVSETARELAEAGIELGGSDDYILKIQELILKRQLEKERTIEEFAKDAYMQDVVILHDRGAIDNKAYLKSDDDFDDILMKTNENEINICDNYDMVINLKSTANLGKEFYMQDEIRREGAEESLLLDNKTTKAWVMAPNIKTFYPTIDKEEKINNVINLVNDFLEGKMEITNKKEKIKGENKALKNIIEKEDVKIIYCTDYYINSNIENVKYIVTKRRYNNAQSCVLKAIKEENGRKYLLKSEPISDNEFLNLRVNNGVIDTKTMAQIKYVNKHGKITTISKEKDGLYLEYDAKDYGPNDKTDVKSKIKMLKFDNK